MKVKTLKNKTKKSPPCGAKNRGKSGSNFTYAQRLQAVQWHLEEQIPKKVILKEIGCGSSTFDKWIIKYRAEGAAGLKPRYRGRLTKNPITQAVEKEIIDIKERNPEHGIRKISNYLRRILFLPCSPEKVRKTLKAADMIKQPKKKPRRIPARPRFFERSKPNQLWQSDITMFRINNKQVYLIGYMDDYSRFVVGLDIYTAQTASNVIGLYRKASLTYGPPKEMLTDNGRQYASWRGKTKFQQEMQKDRIHHLRSQPHHPMTLGKLERFWKTIKTEFLTRAQFDGFDSARERIALWTKYYNFQRPHQGIGGLCPADRFYEIQTEVRKAMEQGIAENVLEIALRGKRKAPFYMIGRMGEQTVTIQAKKGKVSMDVKGATEKKEFVYDLEQEAYNGSEEEQNKNNQTGIHSSGSSESDTGRMVGAPETEPCLQGTEYQLAATAQLGRPCDGSYGESVGTTSSATDTPGDRAAGGEIIEQKGNSNDSHNRDSLNKAPDQLAERKGREVPCEILLEQEDTNEETSQKEREHRAGSITGSGEIGNDPEGQEWSNNGNGSSEENGNQPEDVLRVGGERPAGNAGGAYQPTGWQASEIGRFGKRKATAENRDSGERVEFDCGHASHQGDHAGRHVDLAGS